MAPTTGPHATDSKALADGLMLGSFRGVVLVFGRGYYRDTMGRPGQNDRGILDDALVALAIDGADIDAFSTFNANTDSTRTGLRPDGQAGLAQLVETTKGGVYRYQLGIHTPSKPNRRPALVQHGPVTINRDGADTTRAGRIETGFFGINIHNLIGSTTGSEGCQTLTPEQMQELLAFVRRWTRELGNPVVQVVLVTEEERRAWAAEPGSILA
jgi:hypothetical protein